MDTPSELHAEANRLRRHAEEIAETNPTAAGYHERRADWCDYLADMGERADALPNSNGERR